MIQINNKRCFNLDDILDSFSEDMLRLYTYPLLPERLHVTNGCEDVAKEVDKLVKNNQKNSDLLKFAYLIEAFFKEDTSKSISLLNDFIYNKLVGMTMLNMKEQFKSLFTNDIDSRFFKERKCVYGNAFDVVLCINDILTQNPDFYNDEITLCKLYTSVLKLPGQSNLAEEINSRIIFFEAKQSYFDDSVFSDIDLERLPRRNNKISICVLGNYLVGKTSLLASLFYTMINYYKGEKFKFNDSSVENITLKSNVENMLSETNFKLKNKIILNSSPSYRIDSYQLTSSMHDNRSVEMNFVEIPGSMFNLFCGHTNEILEIIEKLKVFIVVLDTPYLMEAVNPDNSICSDSTNLAVNGVYTTQHLFTYINDNYGKESVLVMFVPVKCEKWLKEHRENEVVHRIEEVYSSTIINLKSYKNMTVKILPIETIGGVEYFEMKIPKTIGQTRCCQVDKNTIRYRDGTTKNKTKDMIVTDYPSCIVTNTHIIRPDSWFIVNNNIYCPRYCERIVCEIIKHVCQ